jgi:hypothetical protein
MNEHASLSNLSAKNIRRIFNPKNATILLTLSLITGLGFYLRYGSKTDLSRISFSQIESIPQSDYTVENLSFKQLEKGNKFYDVTFTLNGEGKTTLIELKTVDISLWIPTVSEASTANFQQRLWLLTEREFNRQKVNFAADSSHINRANLPPELKNISVDLTNNCLGAGYWELAVSKEQGGKNTKVYQGYFHFPRGKYQQLFDQFNADSYWSYARHLEAWPGLNFLKGSPFPLVTIRTVSQEKQVQATDLKNEPVFAYEEQKKKQNKMVYSTATEVKTWEDLRKANPQYHRFVPPGVYSDKSLVQSNYNEIANLSGATIREINNPVSSEKLQEIELNFTNKEGKARKLIISGIEIQNLPQLPVNKYSQGMYHPLGFGPSFTEDYEHLKQNPPQKRPVFMVLLDEKGELMNYRYDVGLNGIVLHRDEQNPQLLHFYPLAYERITLVGHYLINLASIKD